MKSFDILTDNVNNRQINRNLPLTELYSEVKKLLDANNVPMNQYAIGIPDCDERYCLHIEDGLWNIYFSERGLRTNLCLFAGVHDAVNFFVWNLIKDELPEINWSSINLLGNH